VILPCSAASVSRDAVSRPSRKRSMRGISFASAKRFEHAAAALAEHVRDHGSQLYIGVFEYLLDALFVLADLTHQLLAGRVRSRNAWIGPGGTRLARIRPCASKSAIQVASLTSLCAQVRYGYEPGWRREGRVHPPGCATPASSRRRSPPSQRACSPLVAASRRAPKVSAVVVPQRRTSCRTRPRSCTRKHPTRAYWTSNPAQR